MYPWIDESGLSYFKKRLTEARRDVEHGLGVTLDFFSTSREMQEKALDILQFKIKCSVGYCRLNYVSLLEY